jgi:hypothetical protein
MGALPQPRVASGRGWRGGARGEDELEEGAAEPEVGQGGVGKRLRAALLQNEVWVVHLPTTCLRDEKGEGVVR